MKLEDFIYHWFYVLILGMVLVVCVGLAVHAIWFAEPPKCYEVQIEGVRYECIP